MAEVVVSTEDLHDPPRPRPLSCHNFFPKLSLRVLLVEADDSTRQIVAALLRKCAYRVVAVPDGLKAWEILKGKPRNIDLILTEVELPSISGFALLTLIMEHEICKSIPVIMMSSQDSISTVYKCMLRGAADYLVKPIRRNELRNLWQHVWRRKSSITGGGAQEDESVGQQKLEASSENDAESNYSSGYVASDQINKERIEKGSDAQSSCTKPDMEAESAHMENMQEISGSTGGKSLPVESQKIEAYPNVSQKLHIHESETAGSAIVSSKDAYTTAVYKGVELGCQRRDPNMSVEGCDSPANSSREAIDFMGTLTNEKYSSTIGTSKLDSSLLLDLSLRPHCKFTEYHVAQERPTLWHPNASAFTRYMSRPLQSQISSVTEATGKKKESETTSEKNCVAGYNSDTRPSLNIQRTAISLATGQSNQSEVAASSSEQRVIPAPVPVKSIRLNTLCAGYNSVFPNLCSQSHASTVPSPSSVSQQESVLCVNPSHHSNFESNNPDQLYDRVVRNTNHLTTQHLPQLDKKFISFEDRHISSATDQTASTSYCNGAASNQNGTGYGSTSTSNSNIDQVGIIRTSAENKSEDGFFSVGGNSHRSMQREAALTKFRMKRKDRCFEKKVRYESRKKLAEQRPRVKGQFVRQVQSDPPPTEATEHQYGNSRNG